MPPIGAVLRHGKVERFRQIADRRKDDRRIEFLRGSIGRTSGPGCAQRPGKILTPAIARVGKGEYLLPVAACNLNQKVGGRTKSVEADPLGFTRLAQATIANQSGAEQGRRLSIPVDRWNRKAKPLVGDQILRITAIERVTGKARLFAKVFTA